MSEAEFPQRTAGEYDIPGLGTCWIQTLNDLHRERASRAANKHAWRETREVRAGGCEHADIVSDFRTLTPEQQALFLAGLKRDDFSRQALTEHPEPDEPERGDLSEEEYMAACDAWQAACVKAEAEAQKRYEELLAEEKQAALKLKPKARLDRCVAAEIDAQFRMAFIDRWPYELLRYAVRQADNHGLFLFGSVQEVEDLDDPVRAALLARYWELDTVRQEAVPTSAAD